MQNTQKMKDHFKTLGHQKATLKEIELGALYKYFNNDNSHVNMNRGWSACGTHERICHHNMLLQLLAQYVPALSASPFIKSSQIYMYTSPVCINLIFTCSQSLQVRTGVVFIKLNIFNTVNNEGRSQQSVVWLKHSQPQRFPRGHSLRLAFGSLFYAHHSPPLFFH